MSEFRRRLMMQVKRVEFVDYIRTNCTQWFDSGYMPNPNTEVELVLTYDTQGPVKSGSLVRTYTDSNPKYSYNINNGANSLYGYYFWSNETYGVGNPPICTIVSGRTGMQIFGMKWIGDLYYAYINDKKTPLPAPTITHTVPMLFFYREGVPYDYWSLLIHRITISERGVIVKNFLPAVVSGIYGLWEEVEGKFYPSLGEPFLPPID